MVILHHRQPAEASAQRRAGQASDAEIAARYSPALPKGEESETEDVLVCDVVVNLARVGQQALEDDVPPSEKENQNLGDQRRSKSARSVSTRHGRNDSLPVLQHGFREKEGVDVMPFIDKDLSSFH